MNKLLYPDGAGSKVLRFYHQSSYAMAALVPATMLAPTGSMPAKAADVGLAVALPLHGHFALSYVVSDYVPKGLQLPARVGVLGLSVVTAAGLMKLALAGPGIGGTIKQLWSRPEKTSA
ncbi:hypothetical protein H632_c99p0 [Helicosporidium sp. ATCC 50920]|nr:hypothetical protein H632_c99p0 [Helicosporidium sp. ATCC 50920]|eukprot:KDD76803.1 hypothetical protein H632_c99p0 [Helicosporidium sp. ATCC 50920]